MDQQTSQAESSIQNEASNNILTEKIFSNDLILKKILKFLILAENGKTNNKIVQIVRSVQKHWLRTTSTLLLKSTVPVIVLNLDETNSVKEVANETKTNKDLDRFVETLTGPNRLDNSFLPFKLLLTTEYFREKNHQSFLNCLTLLGKELTELEIKFPMGGGTMPFLFPRLILPVLQKVSFQFSHNELPEQPTHSFYGENSNGLLLLQQILNASDDLQEIVIPRANFFCDLVPIYFKYLQIPDSISTLEFNATLRGNGLEVLLKNELPNLTHLTLRLPSTPLENDLMFKILDRFRCSLLKLQLDGDPKQSQLLKFPVMKKLNEIRMFDTEFKLESQSSSDLQIVLPNVKYVGLSYQTAIMFEKWIQNSSFKFLSISLKVDDAPEILAQVYNAFPNINELTISINFDHLNNLVYLFKNMTKLKSLKFEFEGGLDSQSKLESVFLGLPVWLINMYAEDHDFFQSFLRKRLRKPSLVNLTGLTKLTLWAKFIPRNLTSLGRHIAEMPSLISDLLFSQVLVNMPNLLTVRLSRNFKPSTRMEKEWTENGRLIEYIDA